MFPCHRIQKIPHQVYKDVFGPYVGKDVMSIAIALLRPASRGSITLKSSKYQDDPVVDLNFLNEDKDLDLFIRGKFYISSLVNWRIFNYC